MTGTTYGPNAQAVEDFVASAGELSRVSSFDNWWIFCALSTEEELLAERVATGVYMALGLEGAVFALRDKLADVAGRVKAKIILPAAVGILLGQSLERPHYAHLTNRFQSHIEIPDHTCLDLYREVVIMGSDDCGPGGDAVKAILALHHPETRWLTQDGEWWYDSRQEALDLHADDCPACRESGEEGGGCQWEPQTFEICSECLHVEQNHCDDGSHRGAKWPCRTVKILGLGDEALGELSRDCAENDATLRRTWERIEKGNTTTLGAQIAAPTQETKE